MDDECPLCFETYTECKRLEINCSQCEQSCCSECFKNYFLKGDELQLNCPYSCGHVYDPSQIHKMTGNNMSFFRKLLERLTTTNIIYEESLLASTQAAAKHEKDYRDFKEFKKKERAEIAKLKELIRAKNDNLWQREMALYNDARNINEDKNEYTFIKECAHEDCRGKLNSQWKCVLCEKYTCSKCHMPKNNRDDPDHVCDEDIVKNLEALKKESKPCPKCGTAISKSNGCDQMYCVSCHTAFSWRSGRVETGYIHNPEYFRYRRDHGLEIERNPMDRPGEIDECFDPFENYNNRLVTENILRSCATITGRSRLIMLELTRFGLHLSRIDIPTYNTDINEKKKNLRVKYLLGDIDKEKWHSNLKKITKESYFNKETKDILVTLRDIIKDILVNVVVKLSSNDNEKHNDYIVEQSKHFTFWFNKQNLALFNCASAYGSRKILHYEYSPGVGFVNADTKIFVVYQ